MRLARDMRVSGPLVGLVALLGATFGVAPRGDGRPPTTTERVIIRLAEPSPRARFLRQVLGAPLTLTARHERIVTGLRARHETSLRSARGTLEIAIAEGALVEIDRLWAVNAIVADIDPDWIQRLTIDPAIASIEIDRPLTLGGVTAVDAAADRTTLPIATDDLRQIRVDEVWASGVTGLGAIVANVDSGVNGEDATLEEGWRGRVAGNEAAWFAPAALSVFPEDDDTALAGGHGTATMGIMAGGDATFGVAFDATWMAADIFERSEGFVSTALRALQWLMDPDGDPTTSGDVPDVVNNSYGQTSPLNQDGRIACDTIFNDAIDALEAAGAIVVWSAGNEGSAGVTVPANRADSAVNAFAVGAAAGDNDIPFSSGRGPSECGGPDATKPEVVAPGVRVTSRNRFDQTTRFTGTSFSTPMVAGVFALMRSKNPTITPEAAKAILLETSVDLGDPGDDNDSGFGLVDAAAALARVEAPAQPLARLIGFRPAAAALAGKILASGIEDALVLRPGQLQTIVPIMSNHGPPLPASTAVLTTSTAGVTVAAGTIQLAPAATGALIEPVDGASFGISVDGSVVPGSDISLTVSVQGAAVGPFRMLLKVGDAVPGAFATHDNGAVRLTVNNAGGLGFYTGAHLGQFVLLGDGFQFPPGGPSHLFHGGFIAATGADRVSDNIPYGEDTQNSSDWVPLAGSPLTSGAVFGAQRIVAAFDDRHATRPLDLEVRQESFVFEEPGIDPFVILRYIVTNRGAGSLSGLRLGLFADFDLPDTGGDPAETADWEPARRLGLVEGSAAQPAVGVTWLDDVPLGQVSFTVLSRDEIIESDIGDPVAPRSSVQLATAPPDVGEFSDEEKWNALSRGQTNTSRASREDLYLMIGVGPLVLAAGATDTVAVALVAAADRETLGAVAETARTTYFERILRIDPPAPPGPVAHIALRQNFPNPFRAGRQATTIEYDIPDDAFGGGASTLRVAVYDGLGRLVRNVVEGPLVTGEQVVTWDGLDEHGRVVPAGVYVIRLSAGGQSRTVRALVIP